MWKMKAILFDHGGTLDSNGIPWKELFFPLYLECGVALAQEKFDRAFYDADDNLPLRHALKGLGLTETVRLQVTDVLENLKTGSPSAAENITARFVNGCRVYFNRNRPVLAELAKKYRLGVVSNNYGNLESMLESEGLLKYFGVVADSAVVGRTKPDPEIFNYALTRLEVSPENALMVGDNVRRDITGALAMNMRAALLWGDRTGRQTPPELGPQAVTLANLSELPEKLSLAGF